MGFLGGGYDKMGFENRWINLVMMCVRTAQFSVLVNGVPM